MGLTAHFVKTRRKSLHDDLSDSRVVAQAMYDLRHVSFPVPVLSGGKFLGWVKGDWETGQSSWVSPMRLSAFEDYDSIIAAVSSGKRFALNWSKATLAAAIDNWFDLWPVMGNPTNGDYTGSARTARQFDDTSIGALWHGGNVSPSIKYLIRLSTLPSGGSFPRSWILYDRVLTYEACTLTASNQVMTNTLTAQRYISAGQPGLQMCVTGQTSGNATTSDLTQLQYTDHSGNTLQSMPTSPTVSKVISPVGPDGTHTPARVIAPAAIGANTRNDTPFLPLASGDLGVRLVDNYTWSSAPTGTFCLVLAFPIAYMTASVASSWSTDQEFVSGIDAMEKRIYDGACLSFLQISRISSTSMNHGWVQVAWS